MWGASCLSDSEPLLLQKGQLGSQAPSAWMDCLEVGRSMWHQKGLSSMFPEDTLAQLRSSAGEHVLAAAASELAVESELNWNATLDSGASAAVLSEAASKLTDGNCVVLFTCPPDKTCSITANGETLVLAGNMANELLSCWPSKILVW